MLSGELALARINEQTSVTYATPRMIGNLKFAELVPLSQRPVVSSGPHVVLAAEVVLLAASSVVVVAAEGGVRSTMEFGTAIFIIDSISPIGLNSGIRGPR